MPHTASGHRRGGGGGMLGWRCMHHSAGRRPHGPVAPLAACRAAERAIGLLDPATTQQPLARLGGQRHASDITPPRRVVVQHDLGHRGGQRQSRMAAWRGGRAAWAQRGAETHQAQTRLRGIVAAKPQPLSECLPHQTAHTAKRARTLRPNKTPEKPTTQERSSARPSTGDRPRRSAAASPMYSSCEVNASSATRRRKGSEPRRGSSCAPCGRGM